MHAATKWTFLGIVFGLTTLASLDFHSPAAQDVKDEGRFTNSIGMELIKIPAGTFMMGSPKTEAERNDDEAQHEVKLTKPLFMGIHEVTQGQYEKIMGNNPSHFSLKGQGKDRAKGDLSRLPVEQVSWTQAKEFCKKLSDSAAEKKSGRTYRLPTEAEWEYACRGKTKTATHYGNELNTQANFSRIAPYPIRGKISNDEGNTVEVGNYDPNELSLFDMHGNVHEWCEDWYGAYETKGVQTDPTGPKMGKQRVFRGGCWLSLGRACRSACRHSLPPDSVHYGIGFRVVAEVKK
jgi:formylglycine-generating enzyme required for sulfatase activity